MESAKRRYARAEAAPRSERAAVSALRRSIAVMRQRDYLLFWSGMTISMVGTWMQVLAQSWVVVEQISSSATALGWINFASAFPMFVLSLFGGVAADRYDKRRILFVTQFIMMALAFLYAALVGGGHVRLWHVILISALGGIAAAYDMPAFQAYYPTLVKREEMAQAIALNQTSFHGSRVIGPAIGGIVIGAWGATSALIANGFSFLAVVAALLLIRKRPPPGGAIPSSTRSAMAEGFRYVWRDARLRALMGLTALSSLLVFPNVVILMPLYAKNVLNAGPDELGLLMAAGGFGALSGAIGLLLVAPAARNGRIALGAVSVVLGLATIGLSHVLWLSVIAVALVSLGMSTVWGLSSTILQEHVPDQLRGRVMSVHGLTFFAIMPFAGLLIPVVADFIGLSRQQQVAAALYAVVAGLLLRRLVRSPQAAPPIA